MPWHKIHVRPGILGNINCRATARMPGGTTVRPSPFFPWRASGDFLIAGTRRTRPRGSVPFAPGCGHSRARQLRYLRWRRLSCSTGSRYRPRNPRRPDCDAKQNGDVLLYRSNDASHVVFTPVPPSFRQRTIAVAKCESGTRRGLARSDGTGVRGVKWPLGFDGLPVPSRRTDGSFHETTRSLGVTNQPRGVNHPATDVTLESCVPMARSSDRL